MSLGYDRQTKIVALNDSAELSAFLYDDKDQKYAYEDLASVTFTIQRPKASSDGNAYDTTEAKVVLEGEILEDGSGRVVFGQDSIVGSDADKTDRPGHYIGVATFELVGGITKSAKVDFEVFDPFEVVDTQIRIIIINLISQTLSALLQKLLLLLLVQKKRR